MASFPFSSSDYFSLYSSQIWVCVCEQGVRVRADYRLSVRYRSEGITVFRSTMLLLTAKALANSGFAFERTTVFRWGVATEGITVFRSTMLPLIARTLANSGFAFEGTTVFRCGIATGGITVFRSRMLQLLARRRRDCLKLMLSAVCCDKFLTLWDLVSSVFEVSFWAKAFEP